MLMLMRRPNESIMIGDDIVVTVVRIERNRVRIGIEAPKGIQVDREEVFHRRRAEQGLPPMQRQRTKK